MCLPGGPTTISLLLASLSKRLSARWWAPVQRMNHQWRYFSLGRCSSEALCIPKGASLSRIWKRCSVCLQSDSSLSGFLLEFNTQKAVGVVVGFICSKHTPGVCLYGFAQLKPVMSWEIWLFHSSLRKHRNKFQLPFGNDCSELGSTHHTDNRRERDSLPLGGTIMCYSSFDLTQAISAARVLFSSFTLDIKTNGVLPH